MLRPVGTVEAAIGRDFSVLRDDYNVFVGSYPSSELLGYFRYVPTGRLHKVFFNPPQLRFDLSVNFAELRFYAATAGGYLRIRNDVARR